MTFVFDGSVATVAAEDVGGVGEEEKFVGYGVDEVGVTAFGEVAPADGTLEEGVAGEE